MGASARKFLCFVELMQCAPGTLQGGINGRNREIEPFCHFGCRPLQHLAQEQNGPLPWCQVLESHQKSYRDLFASKYLIFRIGMLISEQIIRKRLQPDWLPLPGW